jgi:hypothetical protein
MTVLLQIGPKKKQRLPNGEAVPGNAVSLAAFFCVCHLGNVTFQGGKFPLIG